MLNHSTHPFSLCSLLLLSSCQSIPWLHSQIDGEPPVKQAAIKTELASGVSSAQTDELQKQTDLELKIARLWARVDEQENRLLKQEEKISLLEKGLMLGIVPEKLLSDHQFMKAPGEPAAPTTSAVEIGQMVPSKAELTESKAGIVQTEKSDTSAVYRELLRNAQEKFNSANYGQAIAVYQEIGEKYPEHTRQGQHLYWIGVSWYYLKEYQLARDTFSNLAENYPEGPLTGQTNLYLARIEIKNGLRKKALERLRNIIADHSSDEVGEMARYELSRLEESL